MKIEEKQNQEKFLNYLYAQSIYYDKARFYRRFRTTISIILPIGSVLSILLLPQIKEMLAVIGAVWMLTSRFILQEKEKSFTKIAATIQEQFDTELLGIKWNKVTVGDRVKPEVIINAASEFKKNREKMVDWYRGLKCENSNLNALLAQRTNLVWDQNLRKGYSRFVAFITWGSFFSMVVFALFKSMTVEDFLVSLAIPSLSAIVYGIENSRSHLHRALRAEKIEKEVYETFIQNQNNKNYTDDFILREFQNHIYMSRTEPTVVAKWWYWIGRKKTDETYSKVNSMLSSGQ
ncbi:S-4TM family putative pore-forming effector [Paenibacillus sp. FSL F4-0097]|uniref:S-4TM family putative pore-forming effector n=1 Tax=Paenibacillus sp. FSL F4-0097 TaxID=2921369 RepID=UPI003158FA20